MASLRVCAAVCLAQAWIVNAQVCISDEVLKPLQDFSFAKLCYQRRSGKEAGPEQFNIKLYQFQEDVKYEMWWDDGTEQGVLSGFAPYGSTWETLTYSGHRFRVRRPGSPDVVRIVTADHNEKTLLMGNVTDPSSPLMSTYKEAINHMERSKKYRERTGRDWIAFSGRPPPTLPYLGAGAKLGDISTLGSAFGYWSCAAKAAACQTQPVEMSAQIVSLGSPHVLVIRNVLSEQETKFIMREAGPRLTQGTVGNAANAFKSQSRTSKLVFLPWSSPFMQHLQRRMGDVLQIPHERLVPRAEALQVVQYLERQQYQPHLDAGAKTLQSRFLTLLVVFQPAQSGGCTSFPRAYERKGLTVCLKAGDAVLFYSLLPDGNIDENSVHSGDIVLEGTKWVGNLWISDDPEQDKREREQEAAPATLTKQEI